MPAAPSLVCQILLGDDIGGYLNDTFIDARIGEADNDPEANFARQLSQVTYGYIAPVIITVGIIGDVLTVYTLTHPLLRRSSIVYTYLTLLAMTDLLSQLSVIPMILWLLDMRACSSPAAFYYAHIGFPLANALMGASVWIVVFLTLSQFMAVCRPFAYGMRSRKVCFCLFAVAYLFNFIIYAPWAIKKRVHEVPPHLAVVAGSCSFVVCDAVLTDLFKAYEVGRELICRVLPFFLIATLNARILITYRDTKNDRMRRLANSQRRFVTEKSEKEEKRLFTLLFTICIIFFVCTIPAAPFTFLVSDSLASNVPFQVFRAITNLLEFTKFALNFYFYCLINPDIRRICCHVITCKKLHRPARVKGQPMTPISMYTRWGNGSEKTVQQAFSEENRDKLRSTKSIDLANGTSRRSSTNTEAGSRRNSSMKGLGSGKRAKAQANGNGNTVATAAPEGEKEEKNTQKAATVIQADVQAEKLTVIKETDDVDDVGERL